MPKNMNPTDAYQLINEIAAQAFGENEITVVDTTTFTSVAEKLLRSGYENVMNALSMVANRKIIAARPYKAKLQMLRSTPERFGAMTSKLSPVYTDPTEATQCANFGTDPEQLADGQSVDMYQIKKPQMIQLNYYGSDYMQNHITRFEEWIDEAFESPEGLMKFWDAAMIEFWNQRERAEEAKSRATLLNFIGGISKMGLTEVDLTAEYNTAFGTKYTREQLLSTHLTDFMEFFVATVNKYSDHLTDDTCLYHFNPSGKYIPRHTPKEMQRMYMYGDLFTDARARVNPNIFNPEYLGIGAYETVNYWQSPQDRASIHVKPTILDTDGNAKDSDTEVEIPFVVGLLYDVEALSVCPKWEKTSTTPFNSAGRYYNTFIQGKFQSRNDFTENAVLFVMGAGS